MTHWLNGAADILATDTSELRELALLSGGDPRTFYRGVNLDGVDMRGQDLRGMEFTTLDRGTILVDENTQLDPQYSDDLRRLLSLMGQVDA